MCHENEEWYKNWGELDLSIQIWHEEFDGFSPQHSKISIICNLMGCFLPRYIMFELRKYRGVMFDSTQDWYKIWRKTGLFLLKWHEEFGKFSPEHIQKSKNWVSYWVLLSKIQKGRGLKFTEELFVMKMKNDAKYEEDLIRQFKIDIMNLANFDASTQKSRNFEL